MKKFLRAALVRSLHTMAQTAIAMIGTTALLEEVNWLAVLSGTVLAGILSFLKSMVVGLPEVDKGERG